MAMLGEALRRVGFLAAPSLAVLVAIVAMTGRLGAHRHDRKGVTHPKQYQGGMPPLGGAPWPRWRHTFGPSAMPESHEAPMIARLLVGLQITARWQRSCGHYGRQIASCSRFSRGQREMIMKQFAALAVLALTLSGCVSSPIGAAAGGGTAHDPHWCREHRFYRYDLAWHLHHCGGWCTASGCGH